MGASIGIRAGHPRGSSALFSYFLFLIFLSTGVGLGIGLNWLNRAVPSLTHWITWGFLPDMGIADFFLLFSSQSDDLERFDYDDEMNSIMSDYNFDSFRRNLSPNSNDFLRDLCGEFKVNNVDSPLKDLFKNASHVCR